MSPKYRHRGYKESEREDEERSRPTSRPELTPEERIQKRSLRHAIDRAANAVVRCHNCGRNAPQLDAIERDTVCPSCSTPLHCCRACRHFSPAARWQCTATIPAPVSNKIEANDCAAFEPTLVLDVTGRRSGQRGGAADAKARFDDLFKS